MAKSSKQKAMVYFFATFTLLIMPKESITTSVSTPIPQSPSTSAPAPGTQAPSISPSLLTTQSSSPSASVPGTQSQATSGSVPATQSPSPSTSLPTAQSSSTPAPAPGTQASSLSPSLLTMQSSSSSASEPVAQSPTTSASVADTQSPSVSASLPAAPSPSSSASLLDTQSPSQSTSVPVTQSSSTSATVPASQVPSLSTGLPIRQSSSPSATVPATQAPSLSTSLPSTQSSSPSVTVPVTQVPSLSTGLPSTRSSSPAGSVPTTQSPSPSTSLPSSQSSSPSSSVPVTQSPSTSIVIIVPLTQSSSTSATVPATQVPSLSTSLPTTQSSSLSAIVPATQSPSPSTSLQSPQASSSSASVPVTQSLSTSSVADTLSPSVSPSLPPTQTSSSSDSLLDTQSPSPSTSVSVTESSSTSGNVPVTQSSSTSATVPSSVPATQSLSPSAILTSIRPTASIPAPLASCSPGFTGINCSTNINECEMVNCSGNGVCKDLINGFFCDCKAGFVGVNCESEIDQCNPNPCKNGGTCKNQGSTYKCECTAEFQGSDCTNVHVKINKTTIVNVTEDGSLTINCSIGTDFPEWSRRDGDAVETKTRKIDGVLLHIENASIADTGKYVCKLGEDTHTIWIQVLVRVEVEMELVVENYVFTEELKNKSTPAYKETEKNFTTEMDKVHRGVTEGYVRTEVLGFTKGSVQVDFRIIIQLVTSDPENATDLPDVKAETAQRVVVKAKTGFVERLQVKEVIVKTVPLEPTNVKIFGIDSDELSVQWNPSEDADSFKVTKYRVQHRKFEEKSFTNTTLIASDDKTQYTIRVQPLEPETTYMVRVGAVNKFGDNFNDESAHQTDAAPFPWWIIVVVVLIILLVLVVLVVLIVYKRKRNREREAQQVGAQFDVLESLKDEVASNADKKVKGIAYYSNDAYKPSDLNWDEIPYKDLKLLDELGSGAFGVVYKGEYLQDNGNVLSCAVKALKPSATSEEIRDLYNELEIMGNVGYHPNLVNLIGACTEDGHLLVVLEIAENGSLIEFLKKSRQTDQSFENVSSGLTEQMKTSIATDVARGMAHLAKCKCIHRDLAARNVLLGKDYIAKVSDYGMARDVYEDLMYKKETQGKLPVRWMAIESLQTYIFTMESDVWSYGVLLWEIESGGLKPYAGLDIAEIIAELKKGYRLEKPNGCSEEMYQVMRSCWHPNPSERPTFDQLVIQLERKVET